MKVSKVVGTALSIVVSGLFFNAQASTIDVDTSMWTDALSPSSNLLSTKDVWVRQNINTPTKLSNSSGALISDFIVHQSFTFSGFLSPTFASNGSCLSENTCDDDDILGLVFGWQDADNHYRLGWSQGDGTNSSGVIDVTGSTGLFLVKEENGISTTIQNWNNDFWIENQDYAFSISRYDDEISLAIEGIMQNIGGVQGGVVSGTPATGTFNSIAYTTSDISFLSGNVGVYTESQTGAFSNLTLSGDDAKVIQNVSSPVTLGLLILGGLTLLVTRRNAL